MFLRDLYITSRQMVEFELSLVGMFTDLLFVSVCGIFKLFLSSFPSLWTLKKFCTVIGAMVLIYTMLVVVEAQQVKPTFDLDEKNDKPEPDGQYLNIPIAPRTTTMKNVFISIFTPINLIEKPPEEITPIPRPVTIKPRVLKPRVRKINFNNDLSKYPFPAWALRGDKPKIDEKLQHISKLVSDEETLPPVVTDNLDKFDKYELLNITTTEVITSTTSMITDAVERHLTLAGYVFLVLFLSTLIALTVFGNILVIAAICIEKNLRTVSNYLIVSLAVADLMIACLVMPFAALYEINGGWIFGAEICEVWTATDVLCCTSSILHLVAIALDRYWAVTDIEYMTNRSPRRILSMIVTVWTISILVSVAPQFGWKDPGFVDRIYFHQRCLVSQDVGYQIFAIFSSFFIPLGLILALYWKIFQAARNTIYKKNFRGDRKQKEKRTTWQVITECFIELFGDPSEVDGEPATSIPLREMPSGGTSAIESSRDLEVVGEGIAVISEAITSAADAAPKHRGFFAMIAHQLHRLFFESDETETIEDRREKKAAKTLAIITGSFVMCWLPFFVLALLAPVCGTACMVHPIVTSIFLWLGYFNSTLNPIIYTTFNPEFRQAFSRMLFRRNRLSVFRCYRRNN